MNCTRACRLFGACWDDELTQAERDWLEGHFASCARCRGAYDEFSRTLELAGSLPRVEAGPDLLERVLARTRRASTAPDRLRRPGFGWVPVAASAAAALLVIAGLLASPWVSWRGPGSGESPRVAVAPIPHEARVTLPEIQPAAPRTLATRATRMPARRVAVSGAQVAGIPDSLFDHAEDVEFVLDPVTLHRNGGSVKHSLMRQPGVQGEQALITF